MARAFGAGRAHAHAPARKTHAPRRDEIAMIPLEFYWPADMLARAFPDRFQGLSGSQSDQPHAAPERATIRRGFKAAVAYTSERLADGCVVYRLGKRTQGVRPRAPLR